MKLVAITLMSLALMGCSTSGSENSESALASDEARASVQSAEAVVARSGSYTMNLFNFQYGVATFTPAFLVNPVINSQKIRVRSNCNLTVSAFAKTNVPSYGYFTLHQMQALGGSTAGTGSLWGYPDSPIRALQFLVTQTHQYPFATHCQLHIEEVDDGAIVLPGPTIDPSDLIGGRFRDRDGRTLWLDAGRQCSIKRASGSLHRCTWTLRSTGSITARLDNGSVWYYQAQDANNICFTGDGIPGRSCQGMMVRYYP